MLKEQYFSGQKLQGGIVGDVMVSPAFRNKGIAQQIQKVIQESLSALGLEFLYVVPNEGYPPEKHLRSIFPGYILPEVVICERFRKKFSS